MACADAGMIVDRTKTDHAARVTLADAFAHDRGASQVDISEAVVANYAVADPLVQSTTPASILSSGLSGDGKHTLAQLVARDSIAEDQAFSEELLPPTETADIAMAETHGTIYPEDVDADTASVAEPQGQSMRSGKKGDGKSTSLAELLAVHRNNAGNRNPSAESSPGTKTSVILFGRTGSGKSTLAQMLTLGRLDEINPDFVPSSGIRGETKELKDGEGRDWRVVDTPGFGEPKDPHSTVSSEEAEKKIKKYIQMIEGTYTHFLYTVMRDRIDELDKKLWKFFVRLFGDSIKTNFSVVISNSSVEWVEQNREDLATSFKGCDSFLSAEFPPIRSGDEGWEMELAAIRADSLEQLENALAKLGRDPVECAIWGGFVRTTGASLKRIVMNMADRASSGISGVFRSILQISGLMENGRFVLEPQIGSSCARDKASSGDKPESHS